MGRTLQAENKKAGLCCARVCKAEILSLHIPKQVCLHGTAECQVTSMSFGSRAAALVYYLGAVKILAAQCWHGHPSPGSRPPLAQARMQRAAQYCEDKLQVIWSFAPSKKKQSLWERQEKQPIEYWKKKIKRFRGDFEHGNLVIKVNRSLRMGT